MPPTAAHFRDLETPSVHFTDGPGGLVALQIAGPKAACRIFIQGAHVCEWTPMNSKPVLFVSQLSSFAPAKAIRGGVPICFPWFAARAGHAGAPAHGFLRTAEWTVNSVSDETDGDVFLKFSTVDTDTTRALWPHSFKASFTIRVGQVLELKLTIENTDTAPFTFEEALHTYLTIGDVRSVTVTGLENTEYIDKVEGGARKQQKAPALTFTGETDRVFVNTASTCVVQDPILNRTITVAKTGSATTVVWNPWVAKAAAMSDFGDAEWPGMLCIETANTGENAVSLPNGKTHEMTATISVS